MTRRFFLGGHDLEMLEIKRLVGASLSQEAAVDKGLPWHGALASAYSAEIEAALAAGLRPVLVELRPDLPADLLGRCTIVDHHGDRAGADMPTSLEQVFRLLDLPPDAWTRRLALVAANDRGWIPELRAIDATPAEVEAIRAEDRSAQGITAADEAAAETALANAERRLDGSLLLVYLPHDRTAAVMDRLALTTPDASPPDTLIAGPQELNFSGAGNRVQALARDFPDGWSGGALPARGFWGHAQPRPTLKAVLDSIASA